MKQQSLMCDLCHNAFETWPEYDLPIRRNLETGKGHGVCRSCQGRIYEEGERRMAKAFSVLQSVSDGLTRDCFHSLNWDARVQMLLTAIGNGQLLVTPAKPKTEKVPVCEQCGSQDLTLPAKVHWVEDEQQFVCSAADVLNEDADMAFCEMCGEVNVSWLEPNIIMH